MTLQTEGQFGPNTAEVNSFIERVRTLTNEEATLLGGYMLDNEQTIDRPSAFLKWRQAWTDALDTMSGERYMSAKRALDRVIDHNVGHRPVVLNALVAMLAQGAISEDSFHVLYDPWASVMEVGSNEQ